MSIIEQKTMESIEYKVPEMTLRDYFAGQVLAGIMSNVKDDFGDNPLENIANICYLYADAMIERGKKNG